MRPNKRAARRRIDGLQESIAVLAVERAVQTETSRTLVLSILAVEAKHWNLQIVL